jgi:hypothetical protein
MTALTGFDDRAMVAQCLMYRYVISYEPYFFKGTPDDIPDTIAYGRAMDQLRTELREWLWDGEFRDNQGASVRTSDGVEHHPYSVFLSREDSSPAVVVANYDDKEVVVRVELEDHGALAWRLIDVPGWSLEPWVTLPARSAAVILPRRRAL